LSLRENLWQDDLSQVELRETLIVAPDVTVRQTVETMRESSSGCALICQGQELKGIFTERDLIKRVLAPGVDADSAIETFMTPDPVTVPMTTSVGSVIKTMHQGHYRHLPVVDASGVPIGTVSVKRIVQYLVDHFPSAVYNLPPQPGQVMDAREGA